MENKPTLAANVLMNGEDVTAIRKDLSLDLWEYGIRLQICNLTVVPPVQTSKAVLESLRGSGRKVIILPAAPGDARTEPIAGIEWLQRSRSTWPDATPKDLPPLYCADGSVENRNSTGTPLPLRGLKGTGRGTDSAIYFTSQDYIKTCGLPGGRSDEVLLHELVHALRMAWGTNLCLGMDDGFDTIEEFYAILITNIYRSECGYKTLRADHNGKEKLPDALANDAAYYKRYKEKIDKLAQDYPVLCKTIAAVPSKFNPIRQAVGKP